MITYYHKSIKDQSLLTPEAFRIGSWVNIQCPSEEEINTIAAQLNINSGFLKDALDPYEVPRAEIENETFYIYTRVPYLENGKMISVPVLVAISDTFVLTACHTGLPILDNLITKLKNYTTTQKTKFLVLIFTEINNRYGEILTSIRRGVQNASVNLERIENRDIVSLVTFERNINEFLAALVPSNTILQNLLSGKFVKLFEEDQDLIEDLFLANGQLIELCKSLSNNIFNIREAYSSIMTNNLNRVIKALTALTIILTVPTMIFSLYGMNVRLPLSESHLAFWIIIAQTATLMGIILYFFIRNRWL